ncbi:MAG: ATP-dependent sacrificial sulfur transferase LarE [Spirochaetota bacterium]
MRHRWSPKLEKARDILRRTGGCAVAFSGGVDSSLVLSIAGEVLGERALAVISISSTYAQKECQQAIQWVKDNHIPYLTIVSEELDLPQFSNNPPDRCYYCKKELFTRIKSIARSRGLESVADGTNADDAADWRPGMKAAKNLGVISPLLEAELGKQEIREISRKIYHLPTAEKPAMACLASRFPYGSVITRQKLKQVEEIEEFLEKLGFKNYRARHHGEILRLEVEKAQMGMLMELKQKVVEFAKNRGFTYVTVDLEGYRSGSMNEMIEIKKKEEHYEK